MIKMPLLEHVKSLYPLLSFDKVLVIGCQHILATTHWMFRSLYDQGLKPENIYLLGKCYSTSKSVWKEMQEEGIRVSPLSFYFESHQDFDGQFYRMAALFLDKIVAEVDLSQFEKIIIVDDGGQLLNLSTEKLKGHTHIIGVEQTTSGYEKIKDQALPFPVINVARSPAKLIYESPMIAQLVVEKALKRIDLLPRKSEHILILGNGAIGSAIHAKVQHDYQVQIYDKKHGQCGSLESYLPKADLIIGCTGKTSLPYTYHSYLKKGSILFSASSSDREFDGAYFRQKASKPRHCHQDIEASGIHLLNCGFPINFYGGRHSVAPSKIQLTRALLLSALLQACGTSRTDPEIIPLDIEVQREIITRYLELYPATEKNFQAGIPNPFELELDKEEFFLKQKRVGYS